ncbi:MAG: hypothetical protein AB2693_32370 [Candidatus Thiodiazotropha sp.]
MSTQLVSKVETPIDSSRKRHLSTVSDASDTSPKKARNSRPGQNDYSDDNSDTAEQRVSSTEARRKLYKKDSSKAPRKVVVTEADVHVNAQPSLHQLIDKLSSDMNMMFLSLNERFDKMESSLEQRISSKVAQLLDKRVNSELSKIRKDVDTRMDDFKESIKADLAADLDDIRDELKSHQPTMDHVSAQAKDLSLNIVIRNLPESQNENIMNKVNALFKDGLRLSDISVSDAERKQSRNDSNPGVIIAKLKSRNDKQRVMKEKFRLKDNRRFSKVFIHHDQIPSERSVSSNLRAILRAMNTNNLSMKGSRIVHTDNQSRIEQDASKDSSHCRQREYRNNRRDDGWSGSRSGRNDSDWSNRRDDRQSGNSEWMDVHHSHRRGRGVSRGGSAEQTSRNGDRRRN